MGEKNIRRQRESLDRKTGNPVVSLCIDTLKKGKQALVFFNTKRSAEKGAEDLARTVKEEDPVLTQVAAKILNCLSHPTHQCQRLSDCVRKGAAFHHAGLLAEQKDLIEEHFRKGNIKIICCTPTLAAGVDLPAFRAIIKDLRRYGHMGLTWIPTLEYLQMAGRAGRPSFDAYGEAIAVPSTDADKEEILDRYIHGQPEEISSKLAVEPALRFYLLSLIASGFVHTRESILNFFEGTLWAFQYKDMQRIAAIIDRVLQCLEEWEFIRVQGHGDFVAADELGKERYIPTPMGKRVAELYLDPYTAHHIITDLRRASGKSTQPFSYLHMISSALEMRPLLRVRVREYDDIQEQLVKVESFLLTPEPSLYDPEYAEFLNAVKTSLFLLEWLDEKSEEYLLTAFDIRPGEVRTKIEVADWLLYASVELVKLLNFRRVYSELSKLRLRIKYGVREELLPLCKLKGIGRARARKLFSNKIRDLGAVKKADLTTLSQLIGRQVALSIKQQLGQDAEKAKVKPRKRKGQINIEDFSRDREIS